MDSLLQDFRLGLRQLRKAPLVTGLAIVALALGIGATTAIFSVLDAVLLRPLPYAQSERLVDFTELSRFTSPDATGAIAEGNFLDYAAGQRTFEQLAVYDERSPNVVTPQGPEQVRVLTVSSGFLPALRIQPALGRTIAPEEDFEGHPVALLTDEEWRQSYSADPGVIGRTVSVDGSPRTIIGVLPPGFHFEAPRASGNARMVISNEFTPQDRANHTSHGLSGLGRLKAGITPAQAAADLDRVLAQIAEKAPEMKAWHARVMDLHETVVGKMRQPLTILLAAVAVVMLIACANVAGMLLARGAARHRELCIRAALGATRSRLVRQLLTESVVLGFIAGVLGLLVASWGVDALVALAPRDLPRLAGVRVDARVLVFGIGAALASGLLAGIAPALQLTRLELHDALKESGAQATSSKRRGRVRAALVASEIALALALVVCAGLLLRSFQRVVDTPLGFDPSGVLSAKVARNPTPPGHDAESGRFIGQVVDRIAHAPGVEKAAAVSLPPLGRGLAMIAVVIEGKPEPAPGERADVPELAQVTPGYFDLLRIPFVRGRNLASAGAKEAVVNEAFVREYMPGRDPLGVHVHFLGDNDPKRVFTLVGVIADLHTRGPDRTPAPNFYIGAEDLAFFSWTVLVRGPSPLALAPVVRREVQALDPAQPVSGVRLFAELRSDAVAQRRFQMLLVGVFGVLAFVLAAVGIYGVTAFSVEQRTHEIGVRAALGATPMQLLRMVLMQALRLAAAGLGLGFVAALVASRAMRAVLYGVSPADPITYLLVALALGAVTLLASFVPARRATRVNPGIALRAE